MQKNRGGGSGSGRGGGWSGGGGWLIVRLGEWVVLGMGDVNQE